MKKTHLALGFFLCSSSLFISAQGTETSKPVASASTTKISGTSVAPNIKIPTSGKAITSPKPAPESKAPRRLKVAANLPKVNTAKLVAPVSKPVLQKKKPRGVKVDLKLPSLKSQSQQAH